MKAYIFSVYQVIYQEVKYYLKKVIEVAKKFKCHCKTDVLSVQAIEIALQNTCMEPVYGINSKICLNFLPIIERYNFFYTPCKILNINEVIELKVHSTPDNLSLKIEWLALEGQIKPDEDLFNTPARLVISFTNFLLTYVFQKLYLTIFFLNFLFNHL